MKHEVKYPKLLLKNQLCFPLYAASRRVVAKYTPVLSPFGLTYTQYLVFLVLWEEDDIPVGELCQRLCLDNGTVTPLLKKMEKAGWLTRTRSEQDERVVVVRLTPEGSELQEKLKTVPDQVGQCLCCFSPEETRELYRLLYKLIKNPDRPACMGSEEN